jgi:ribbon-helix-helix protein
MKMKTSLTKQPHYSPAYKTKTRQKYSLYIDDADLSELKAYEKSVGVPVSESIRRAISCYLGTLQSSSNGLPTLVIATKLKR